jgi:hypothetical protein
MAKHAFVTWAEIQKPWELEARLLSSGLRLPLNLAGNPSFDAALRLKRSAARRQADALAGALSFTT